MNKEEKLNKIKSILLSKEKSPGYYHDTVIELMKLIQLIPEGKKGDKGYTPKKGKDYDDGKDGQTPIKGVDYDDGKDAYTPVKGKDYFTKDEIVSFLKKITPKKGKDYFTEKEIKWFFKKIVPIKGIDYWTDKELQVIKEEIKKVVTPKKGIDYHDGYTPVKGKDYFDGVSVDEKQVEERLLITLLERLENKLDEDLTEKEKTILEELEKKLGEMVQRLQGRSGGLGRQDVLDIISGNQPNTVRDDLSSQCDSSNMVFNLSKVGIAGTYVLQGTQFPIIYRPGVDYNVASDLKTVTLVASEVGPPQAGQTLIMRYEEKV